MKKILQLVGLITLIIISVLSFQSFTETSPKPTTTTEIVSHSTWELYRIEDNGNTIYVATNRNGQIAITK